MTNRQAQVCKFSPTRSEQPKYNPNWWFGLPKTHPLHSAAPTRQQRRAKERAQEKRMNASPSTVSDTPTPNRHERRKAASITRRAARAAMKGTKK